MREVELRELVLATKELGDSGARSSSQVCREGIDDCLGLCNRVTRKRSVANDVSTHRVASILRGHKRVSRDLRVLEPDRPAVPTPIGVGNRQSDQTIGTCESAGVRSGAGSRKRNSDAGDGNGLGVGVRQGTVLAVMRDRHAWLTHLVDH